MDPTSADYGRMVVLERENQALREQVRDLQQLLQVKDQEIALKYHLFQSKERENAQARARLQLLEAASRHSAEAEADRLRLRAAGVFPRDDLLRLNGALRALQPDDRPEGLQRLTCVERADVEGLEPPETPSKGTHRTPLPSPSGGSKSSLATPTGAKSAKGRTKATNGGELTWKARQKPEKDTEEDRSDAPVEAAASSPTPAESVSRASPEKGKKLPPALDQLDAEPDQAAGRASPEPAPKSAEEAEPVVTPNKRLAIVDPVSGKQIEVTPSREKSSVKPTLISLEAISEGSGVPPPASPTGPLAPPLTLPPVVAGAPSLAAAPSRPAQQPAAYPGLPSPGPLGGLPPPLGPPYQSGQAAPYGYTGFPFAPPPAALPSGLPGYPPALPGSSPAAAASSAPPPCPPPLHPAPTLAASSAAPATAAPAGVGGKDAAVRDASAAAQAEVIASGRLADALSSTAGGPVQMARGPLAGGPPPTYQLAGTAEGGAASSCPTPQRPLAASGAAPGAAAPAQASLLGTVPMAQSGSPMDQLGLVPPRGWAAPSQAPPTPTTGGAAAPTPPPAAPAATSLLGFAGYAVPSAAGPLAPAGSPEAPPAVPAGR